MDKQIAIVTVVGSGIGRAIAIALAADGYHVALIGRNRKRLEETLEILEKDIGTGSTHPGDSTVSTEVNTLLMNFLNLAEALAPKIQS